MTQVLLIDDEEALRASLSYALVKEGYKKLLKSSLKILQTWIET